jgi:subtilisin family serine protease
MKAYWFLSALLLTLAIQPRDSLALSTNNELPKDSSLTNSNNAERLLLVGFPDQSIKRIDSLAATDNYRRRGAYQSSTWSRRITTALEEDYQLKMLNEWPMTEVSVHCVVFQIRPNASLADTIQRLSKDTRVSIVQPMNVFHTQAKDNDPYAKLQSNLQQMQINKSHDMATGKKITIAMIDTGVDIQHPDLVGQISQYENFAAEISPGFANDKHGTAVAGIMVARKDNGIGIFGIAPDAKLLAYKACWPNQADAMEAVCNSYTLALAVNSAITSNAKILNMSLSGPQDAILELLLKKAIDNGMIVVAANTKNALSEANFPASLAGVVSVNSASVKPASDSESKVSAPGEKILTTIPHGTYDFISGSSMSTAEISGIIALLLEISPDLNLVDIKSILESSKQFSKSTIGINANAAILALCKTTSCPEQTLKFAKRNAATKFD